MSYVLGISSFYHDSSATLLNNGKIIASIEEEKFSRVKHDKEFPKRAIEYCLSCAGISINDLEGIVFYDKPLVKFERLLESYISFAPMGFELYAKSLPEWFNGKIFLEGTIRKDLHALFSDWSGETEIFFAEHHQSHAASAYFASPYEDAAILCLDGVGEWNTTTTWHGKGNKLSKISSIDFPHSLGLLYSAFTYFLGFEVNNGEYKMMGLAPYGEPEFVETIRENLIDIKEDGSFRLDMSFFNYGTGLTMTNEKFNKLFKMTPREKDTSLSQIHMNLAASIQKITEEVVIRLAQTLQQRTGAKNLCLAGGVALNCVANGELVKQGIFENIWIQPASGDAGGSLGSALCYWHQYLDKPKVNGSTDIMQGSYLGPEFSNDEIREVLNKYKCHYEVIENSRICATVASELSNGQVVGWFQGRSEYGPRALGHRSILGDPRCREMQSKLNLKIKYRESFRPFAPAVLKDQVSEYFDMEIESPYMLLTAPISKDRRIEVESNLKGLDQIKSIRSDIPAVTHVDYSARVQTVSKERNDKFYDLLDHFHKITKCPVLINTSFNIRGEPIVLSPYDALNCFMNTEMDILAIGDFVLRKEDQNIENFKSYSTHELGVKPKKTFFKKLEKDITELKSFGYQFTIILAVIVGVLLPKIWNYQFSIIPIVLGAICLLLRSVRPTLLYVPYIVWTRFSEIMGFVNSKVLLFVSYFALISPIGVLMKVLGKDPIEKKYRSELSSYLKDVDEEYDPKSLKRPF
ncbi:hypothetical protein A9Q84_19885 [Halobacteriovorax marinus]|uniref:Carbamoyltransferase n=1 Tax=Halobacteriovorax marinus TaxID=97084 RepID=A0A1Y5F2R5_9BACT|nr:hypothetical protein A9Q84_19885 [Halobacteriovorax marinus]